MHIVISVTGGQGFLPEPCNNQRTAEAFAQDIIDRYGNTEYFDDEAAEYYEVESWWWRLVHWFRAFPKPTGKSATTREPEITTFKIICPICNTDLEVEDGTDIECFNCHTLLNDKGIPV